MIKVLILEDEEYTREFFKTLLLQLPEVSDVFDTSYAIDAILLAKEHCPDLILLDIELYGQDFNGLEVAKQIHSFDKDVYLVFVTGYSHYALDSIAVHPYAYVLKPINVNEFINLIRDISGLLEEKRLENLKNLIIKTRGGIIHIPKNQIVFMEKDNGHTLIHTYGSKHQVSRTLDELEKQVGNDFIRVHRSFIINIKHVLMVREVYDRSYEIQFYEYQEKALMSRYHFKRYKKLFQI